MALSNLIVFVEEPSMEVAMTGLLPKIVGETPFQIIRFQCKNELIARLPERLKGYSSWIPEDWAILVIVDRDDDDCRMLKQVLEQFALDAGLRTRATAKAGQRIQVVNRIAIEELEAWFFGDWTAVIAAYSKVVHTIPQKAGFRDPDGIAGGTWEALERVLKNAGYFPTGLRKIECARTIVEHMEPVRNSSKSFQAMHSALAALCAAESD